MASRRKKGQPSLPSYLGDRLHKALRLYLYTTRTQPHGADPLPVIFKQIEDSLTGLRTRLNIADGHPLVFDGWTEDDIRTWLHKNIHAFITWMKAENITWYREEWPLEVIRIDGHGRYADTLGAPDLVGYSATRKAWVVIDFKNAAKTTQYADHTGIREPDKLLGYAYGARQKLHVEHQKHLHPIIIGYMVFIRRRMRPGEQAHPRLIAEKVDGRRLAGWRRRYKVAKLP